MDSNWNNWNNINGDSEAPESNLEKPTEETIEETFAEPVEENHAIPAEDNIAEPVEENHAMPAEDNIAEPVEENLDDATPWPAFNEPQHMNVYEDIPQRGKEPGYVTKKALAIALICTMLATSGLTVGGLFLGGAFDKRISAYNNNIPSASPVNTEAGGSQLSIQEIAAINENAIVEIQTEKLVTDFWLQNYITQGAGSGVIIDSEGYILTCNHVIENARAVTVTTKNGAHYDAEVIGADELTDIAVLKVKGSNFTTVTYGDSSALSIGDTAIVMGNPLGQLGGSISTGIISALDRSVVVEGKAMTLIQTDAAINPGNSGGGLFDGSGKLVGVVVARAGNSSSPVEGIGFAVPINQASVIADQLIEYGEVRRPLIGVMIVDVTTEAAAEQFGVDELGLYIDDVPGENAKEAGFQKGDIIKAINGNPIRNRNDLTVEINRNQVGDKVTITVSRDGELIDIETVLQYIEQ